MTLSQRFGAWEASKRRIVFYVVDQLRQPGDSGSAASSTPSPAWLAIESFAPEALALVPYREPAHGVRVTAVDAEVNGVPSYGLPVLIRCTG